MYINVKASCSSRDICIMGCVSQCCIRKIILSLLLAGGFCFCFRFQELVVEICVDFFVSSIVYTSTIERDGDRKGGVWKVVMVICDVEQRSLRNRL